MTDKLREAAQLALMAYYALVIKADSGYESTTEGRCTADQYGAAMAALHGTAALAQQDAQAEQEPTPDWISYNKHSDVLTIHGRRYDAALFDERGFGSPPGTLLRIVDGPADVVTLERVAEQQDAQKKHKPLFAEMIAQHPGLAEELAQQDAKAEPQDDVRQWNDGFRAAMNSAASGVRELYINHCFHHGVDGLLERCKRLEQSFICHADSALNAAPTPPAPKPLGWLDRKAVECLQGAELSWMPAWNRPTSSDPVPIFLLPPAQRVMLTDEDIREWWVSENGLEDCDMTKLDDFTKVVRAVIEAYERKNAQPKTLPAPLEQQGNPYPST